MVLHRTKAAEKSEIITAMQTTFCAGKRRESCPSAAAAANTGTIICVQRQFSGGSDPMNVNIACTPSPARNA